MAITLAWGPGHGAAAEQVDVEVVYGLAPVGSGVNDGAVAVGQAFSFGDLLGHGVEVAEQVSVGFLGFSERVDVFAGYYEDVGGRLGMNVAEGVGPIIFEYFLGRNFPAYDFAE